MQFRNIKQRVNVLKEMNFGKNLIWAGIETCKLCMKQSAKLVNFSLRRIYFVKIPTCESSTDCGDNEDH